MSEHTNVRTLGAIKASPEQTIVNAIPEEIVRDEDHNSIRTQSSTLESRLRLLWLELSEVPWEKPTFYRITLFPYLLDSNHPASSCRCRLLYMSNPDYPLASRRLLDHHVRELPCANYPPTASGLRRPWSSFNTNSQKGFGTVALKEWTCQSVAGGAYTLVSQEKLTHLEVLGFLLDEVAVV